MTLSRAMLLHRAGATAVKHGTENQHRWEADRDLVLLAEQREGEAVRTRDSRHRRTE